MTCVAMWVTCMHILQTKDGRRGGGQGRGQEWHLSDHAPKRDVNGLTAPPNHLAPCSASCSGGVATRRALRCMHTCANTRVHVGSHEPVLKTSQQIEWVILTSQMVVCRRWWRSGTSTSKCRRCHQGSHEEDRTRHGGHCVLLCVSFGLDFFLVISALHCAASMFFLNRKARKLPRGINRPVDCGHRRLRDGKDVERALNSNDASIVLHAFWW
jgi:hypothetical protein